MDQVSRRRRPAWVAWAELEAAIRATFPSVDPETVFLAVELGDLAYRLRCSSQDGGDLVPWDSMAWMFDGETVLPYKLRPEDWDVVDRERGLFRHYPIEVSWRDVLQMLGARPAVPVNIDGTASSTSAPAVNPEAECQRRLEAIMRDDPHDRLRRKNAILFPAMQAVIPGLSYEAFRRAKVAAVRTTGATAFTRPGARGTPPPHSL